MKETIQTIQALFTAAGVFVGWFLGGLDGFMYALLAFVVIDYLTGIMVAILEKKLSSEIGFRGIFKKILIFILVGVGNIIDVYIIGNGSAVRTAVIFFMGFSLLSIRRVSHKRNESCETINHLLCGWRQKVIQKNHLTVKIELFKLLV